MFERFKHRSYELERLDTGDYTPEEYSRWEREMRWVHGTLGEARALRNSLLADAASVGSDPVSVLDIGAGSGEILKFVRQALTDGSGLDVALELSAGALATLQSAGLAVVKGDATRLPFADSSFDYVICTLLMHHLSDEDGVRLVAEMNRVARRNFYVIDLHRHPVGYYLYRFISPLFLQKFTQEDGALSILRSFTPREMREIADKAGVLAAKVRHSRANRLILSRK